MPVEEVILEMCERALAVGLFSADSKQPLNAKDGSFLFRQGTFGTELYRYGAQYETAL